MAEIETSSLLLEPEFDQVRSSPPSDSSSRPQSPPDFGTGSTHNISLDVIATQRPPTDDSTHQRSRSSTHQSSRSYPTSQPLKPSSSANTRRPSTASIATATFDFLSYSDVDTGQQEEFHFLLARETGWRRLCCHKGLVVNLFFLFVMVLGIVLGEVLYPLEGFNGSGRAISNDTMCLGNLEGCISVRVLRAVGLFGFIGGITNWVAIEMLFIRVPFLIGTGVIAKQYKEIRDSIRRIVVNTLFDPAAVSEYFSGQKKYAIEMLHLGHHFGGLLDSAAANTIVEQKIDLALAGPEGFVLTMLGVDHRELKSIIRKNVQLFLADISPIILDRVSPGLMDGEALQAEVELILERKIEELSATKVKEIITLIIRKHLSWLIVWGNISGAVVGVLSELATLLATYLYVGL